MVAGLLVAACEDTPASGPAGHDPIGGPVTDGPAAFIGVEVAIARHFEDGEEFEVSVRELLRHGEALFKANWTGQEGGGRPFMNGIGKELADPEAPLVFPFNFNRVSAPDANSCAGCHNAPFGIAGGGGDFVANVFVLAQRFDFATFDVNDGVPLRGTVDERGVRTQLDTIANSRATLGMFGSGYIEMLARQISADLRAIRDAIKPGEARELRSKGLSFGTLRRSSTGAWLVVEVQGLPASSLASSGPNDPPSLVVRPFHQAGAVVSIREFTNNAYNHHHGIQAVERFGAGKDPDGDGTFDELTRADVTAVSVFQAALPVPGRRIPNDPLVEQAVLRGEQLFAQIGCADCHVPSLPLDQQGWLYSEPNPFNPAGNLRPGDAPPLTIDLNSSELPGPRLRVRGGRVDVPAYTDLKLHDITGGPDDPNGEPLDMTAPAGSAEFFAGNRRFITKKLWGAANEPPYFHHGKFTTMREAIFAHAGEAQDAADGFRSLDSADRDAVIEFLKTLQILPPGTDALVVDEHGREKRWPPAAAE
jgi:hypothetical protein